MSGSREEEEWLFGAEAKDKQKEKERREGERVQREDKGNKGNKGESIGRVELDVFIMKLEPLTLRQAPLDTGGRKSVRLAVDDGGLANCYTEIPGLNSPLGRHYDWKLNCTRRKLGVRRMGAEENNGEPARAS